MFNFDLKKADIYQAVKWEKHVAFRFAGRLKKACFALFVILLIIFLYGFLMQALSEKLLSFAFGAAVILLCFSISF